MDSVNSYIIYTVDSVTSYIYCRTEILSSDPVLSTAHEGEEGETVEGLQDVEWCEEDDDVMTPPSVLLDRALRQAEIYTRQKQVSVTLLTLCVYMCVWLCTCCKTHSRQSLS